MRARLDSINGQDRATPESMVAAAIKKKVEGAGLRRVRTVCHPIQPQALATTRPLRV
jgi:hypothetical protein